ncbi:hypothetical protein NTH44_003177 [Vibrio metoecus]
MNEISEVSSALKDQGLALVRVDISGTDFKKSLKSRDIGLEKEVERELATLGRKSVFGNEFPKLLRNNKDQTYTYLDRMGVRFGAFGTWAVPVNIYKEVIDFLEQKKTDREVIKARLLRHYDTELQQFAKRAEELRPGFGKIVMDNAYCKDHIHAQIQFVIEAQNDIMSGVSLSAIQGLSRMAKDYEIKIMKKAKETNTRPVITRFTRSVLEEMRDFCYRFVFLTGVLNHAAELIQDTIDVLPPTVNKDQQYIEETSKLLTTLKLLREPDELEGIIIGASSNKVNTPIIGVTREELAVTNDEDESFEVAVDEEMVVNEFVPTDLLDDEEFEEFEDEWVTPPSALSSSRPISLLDLCD